MKPTGPWATLIPSLSFLLSLFLPPSLPCAVDNMQIAKQLNGIHVILT